MPKHKKTLEQKKKADERKFVSPPTYVFSATEKGSVVPHPAASRANSVVVVQHDLKKTAFISLSILALQILFFLLLKNHLLAINFVRY